MYSVIFDFSGNWTVVSNSSALHLSWLFAFYTRVLCFPTLLLYLWWVSKALRVLLKDSNSDFSLSPISSRQ